MCVPPVLSFVRWPGRIDGPCLHVSFVATNGVGAGWPPETGKVGPR